MATGGRSPAVHDHVLLIWTRTNCDLRRFLRLILINSPVRTKLKTSGQGRRLAFASACQLHASLAHGRRRGYDAEYSREEPGLGIPPASGGQSRMAELLDHDPQLQTVRRRHGRQSEGSAALNSNPCRLIDGVIPW